MGHGADLSKKRPPVGFGKSSPISEIEYTKATASNEQTMVCTHCRQNRRASTSYAKRNENGKLQFETVVFSILGDISPLEPGKPLDEDLGIHGCVCCSKNEDEDFTCVTFGKIIDAYYEGVQKRGCLINPCQYCDRFWNKDHVDGTCPGKYLEDRRCDE